MLIYSDRQKQGIISHTFTLFLAIVTTQHPMGMSNRLTVVLQQELH